MEKKKTFTYFNVEEIGLKVIDTFCNLSNEGNTSFHLFAERDDH